jgi:hypothetical protein
MTASDKRFPIIPILLVLWAVAGVAPAEASQHEINPPPKAQSGSSVDQILNRLTDSALKHEGLDQSNLAIDQIVHEANQLIRKASKERDKVHRKDAQSPFNQVLGQAILALTDANAYLLKLKELQNALMAVQGLTNGPAVDTHQTCKDLNREFNALLTDLTNLKLSIKTLPLPQRAIADVILWDVGSRLNTAIRRIRLRTIRIGTALSLESELNLKAH